MHRKLGPTKKKLLVNAGKLFAKYGYDGVGTRAITNEVGITLSSIHHHFGSKENLYMEALRYAMAERKNNGFIEVLEENPELGNDLTGQAEIIRKVVYRNFNELFKNDKEEWERMIFIREVVNPSSASSAVESLIKSDLENVLKFYRKIKPQAGEREVIIWLDILYSQLFYYAATEKFFTRIRREKITDTLFYMEVAKTVSCAMIIHVGLPLPNDLMP